MALRQLATASLRSESLNSTRTSFSASANVSGDTSGPTGGAVAKAGGAPGGNSAVFFSSWQEVTAIPRRPRELLVRNCLRDLDMAPLLRILECLEIRGQKNRRSLHYRVLYQGTTFSRAVKNGNGIGLQALLTPGAPHLARFSRDVDSIAFNQQLFISSWSHS